MPTVHNLSSYEWLAPAIINDDPSGLENDDEKILEKFWDRASEIADGDSFHVTMQDQDADEFGMPDVGDLRGTIVVYQVVVMDGTPGVTYADADYDAATGPGSASDYSDDYDDDDADDYDDDADDYDDDADDYDDNE